MGKFVKGQRANPAGRPKGIEDKRLIYKRFLEKHSDDLVKKALELALDGSETMLRLLIDRILPAKSSETLQKLPLDPSKTTLEQFSSLIEALRDGTISTADATQIASIIQVGAKIEENALLREEIEELKQQIELQGGG